MSATPHESGRVDLRPRRITPRRLGAAAVVYGVFVAGWYLGQPVTAECRSDQAAVDRVAEQYGHVPVSTPTPAPSTFPAPLHDEAPGLAQSTMAVAYSSYVVICANDTGERPRLQAWFEGDWK